MTRYDEIDYSADGIEAGVEECSECGHLHFRTTTRTYDPCPLKTEGCGCPYVDGDSGIYMTVANAAGEVYSVGRVTLQPDEGWFFTDEEGQMVPTYKLFEQATVWANEEAAR